MKMNSQNSNRQHPLARRILGLLLAVLGWLAGTHSTLAVTPPVVRSTLFNGGATDVIHYSLNPWMNTNTPNLTVEAWIYANDVAGHQAIVARSFSTNLYFGLNGNRLRFYRSGGTFADSTGTIVALRWTHVAASYDGITARFYINGNAAGTAALANRGNNSTNGLTIGGQFEQNLFGLYAFNGYIDELRLWSVARTGLQIAGNFDTELRSGTGLLATFGSGGRVNDLTGETGYVPGQPLSVRESGFGILPKNLCVPWTTNTMRLDATIDPNEYRGAETIVLRSTTSTTAPDYAGYLMVCSNAANFHLFVGLPTLPQGGTGTASPVVQVMADVNVTSGTTMALGDWECRLQQDGFQGGTIMRANPPLIPTPEWTSWGQSSTDWQAATTSPFEFTQAYEFRVHGRHLNYFTNVVGLLVRYFDYVSSIGQWSAPRPGLVNIPSTFARTDWCGVADSELEWIRLSGSVYNQSAAARVPGRPITVYSGSSELSGYRLASTTTDADGRFIIDVLAPIGRAVTITYQPPSGANVIPMGYAMEPILDPSGHPVYIPILSNSETSVAFLPRRDDYGFPTIQFTYRLRGPLSISAVSPATVVQPVVLRTTPLKTTAAANVVLVTGTNFHHGMQVYFQASGCDIDPPSLCDPRYFVEATSQDVADDGRSVRVGVPDNLVPPIGNFRVVIYDPNFSSVGGSRWNYGPSISVTPPPYPLLHGFEFRNDDDGPSWQEFDACFGDNVFVDAPFSDEAIRGVRDPYYMGFYLPIYLAWMTVAEGSCSGFAATSRLMANGLIPADAYDRPDNGDSVHGVRYAAGYPSVPDLNPVRPARWTGFNFFNPFEPINLWGKITSMQGAQTSAEFLNSWLGQLRRPIASGPRRGLSVGDPVQVLTRVRANPAAHIIIVGDRNFEALHSVTPYAVVEEHGLAADALTPTPRAGFTLIKVYDSNHPGIERHIEIDRAQNTMRYPVHWPAVCEGAGLYSIPLTVFSGSRHALGPVDIGANLENLLRVLHTGAATVSMKNSAGGTAGWSGSNLVNTYTDATPIVPPGARLNQPDRFDRTLFLLPATNPPTEIKFLSAGSNVVLHYALGGGDFAFGFHAPDDKAENSVYGILMPPTRDGSLMGLGLRAGAPVRGFSASVASRDLSRRSVVWQLDSGAGTNTPNLHLQRDDSGALKIRNHSDQPISFRVNISGTDGAQPPGVFEFSADAISQPGNSTLTLKPQIGANQGFTQEFDKDNDGVPEAVEQLPARGALRATKESGVLALRWRSLTRNDVLLCETNLNAATWPPAKVSVVTQNGDNVARVSLQGPQQFYRVQAAESSCLSLAAQPAGSKPNPWTSGAFRFESFKGLTDLLEANAIVTRNGATGLDVVQMVRIEPLEDCRVLHLDVRQTSGLVTFEAIGPLGTIVDRQELVGAGAGLQRVTLGMSPNPIRYVRVISPGGLCLISNVCGERNLAP